MMLVRYSQGMGRANEKGPCSDYAGLSFRIHDQTRSITRNWIVMEVLILYRGGLEIYTREVRSGRRV